MTHLTKALLASALILGSTAAQAEFFERISSFPVASNLPAGSEMSESSAEIISVTADGRTLVYSDSPLQSVGFVDLSDPLNPLAAGTVSLGGEPTSVVVSGQTAFAAINTSLSYTETSGTIISIDVASRSITSSCELAGQPDAVAVNNDGSILAIAIENERDEDLNDGLIPQMPAGHVILMTIEDATLRCDTLKVVDVSNRSSVAPSDPEPEFVDFNSANDVVVSLQENNHFIIIDADTAAVVGSFGAGSVDLMNVDLLEERALTFDGVQLNRAREPDAVQWLDDTRFVSANEGDYKGGSRGFTIFDRTGSVLFESGLDFEYRVATAGHYPERRSGNKGVEPEGLEVGTFDGETYIFVLAERSSVMGVYRDTGATPEFVQLLPTALGPESAVAIPSRNLLVVANEVDLVEDGGVRSYISVYRYGGSAPNYPMLQSSLEDGTPIGWGALSGLAADPVSPNIFYAVNDSFYAMQPRIFTIDASMQPAQIVKATDIKRGGQSAQLLDLEGIVSDGDGGFWLASEGRPDRLKPHAIYHVDGEGNINKQIAFPAELMAVQKRWASEGITLVDNTLWIAIQRPWSNDPDDHVKLVSYNLSDETWGAVHYPLDAAEKGWHGLSEITLYNNMVYLIERDNQIGQSAVHKKLFRVPVSELRPASLGDDLPVVTKTLVHDFIPDLLSTGGYVVDKIEGFAISNDGKAFALTDNDGVHDSNGETLFFEVQDYDSPL